MKQDKTKAKKRRPKSWELSDVTWWSTSDADLAGKKLMDLMNEEDSDDKLLRTNTRRLVAAYERGARAMLLESGDTSGLDEEVNTYNMARNFLETMISKIAKTTVSPMAMTEGGGIMERREARQVEKAIEGEFEEHDIEAIKEAIITDAVVTDHGAGFAKVYERDEHIVIEHVPAEDIRFDRHEMRLRKPRSIFQRHDFDKYHLAHLYPEHADAIFRAAGRRGDDENGVDAIGEDRIYVFEGWHLRSTSTSDDGKHVMAIDGATLCCEDWDEDSFPFAEFIPRPRMRSKWGLSAMRDMLAPQNELENLTEKIQRAHDRLGMAGFIGSKAGEVNVKEIAGEYGIFIEHAGASAPTPFTFSPVDSSTYGYREGVIRDMGNALGISQFSAQSQVPAGLSNASGKALQVFESQEDGRMVPYHRELNRWTVRLSWLVIRLAKRMTDRGVKLEAKYRDKRGWERIDWARVVKNLDHLVLKVFPVSNLSKQPAARFAQLQELLNAQAITVEQFKRLFEIPDLESELDIDTGDTDVVDMMLEGVAFEGKVMTPEPFDDLDLLITRAAKFYSMCRVRSVPEDRLQLLRDLIDKAKTLQDKAKAAAPPPPAMPGPGMLPEQLPGMPPGLPMPPGGGPLPPPMPVAPPVAA